MPATTGPSSCSTVWPILRRPSARSVPRCFCVSPMALRTCVIRTFAIALRLRALVRKYLVDRQAAGAGDFVGPAEPLQPVDGRLGHVDRVGRPEALREDVADPGELE